MCNPYGTPQYRTNQCSFSMNTRQATTSSSKDMDIFISPWWACIIQCMNLTMHSVFWEVGTAASQLSSHMMKNHADQEAGFGSPFTSTLVSLVARELNSRTWKSIATTSESAYLMSPNESLEILYNSPYTWISREEGSSVLLSFLNNFSFTTPGPTQVSGLSRFSQWSHPHRTLRRCV